MTGMPAARLNPIDRGLLRPGMKADLAICGPVQDTTTFENPHQYGRVFSKVIVNGQIVFENGMMTAARPVRVLYGPGKR
jgi:N-acyl-D-amino-acid deacylase